VTSVFKIRLKKFANFTKYLKLVKIHTNSFYNITSNCKVFEFAQLQSRTILQSITLNQLLNGNSGQLRTATPTQGKTVKLQVIRRLCNKLLMIMLNCCQVKLTNLELLTKQIF